MSDNVLNIAVYPETVGAHEKCRVFVGFGGKGSRGLAGVLELRPLELAAWRAGRIKIQFVTEEGKEVRLPPPPPPKPKRDNRPRCRVEASTDGKTWVIFELDVRVAPGTDEFTRYASTIFAEPNFKKWNFLRAMDLGNRIAKANRAEVGRA
jgi:hypothetical protein